WVRRNWRELRQALAVLPAPHPLLLLGMEYTDHRYGHVSIAFVELPNLLDQIDGLAVEPARLFSEVRRRGGLLIANHPLVTPLDSWIQNARVDLRWPPPSPPDHPLAPSL